jgi:serine protease inhibitor
MQRLILGTICALALTLPLAAKPGQLKGDSAAVVDGNNAFAAELYGQLAGEQVNEKANLFFSPYSISNALAMTYAGARGNTARQMAATLHFDLEPAKFHSAFAQLIRELQGDAKKRKFVLRIANRLWGQKDYGFLPTFTKFSEAMYGAGLKEVDFVNDRENARLQINRWVEEETNDKIKELIKPDVLSVDTRLVLTNAIYFKAAWLRPFSVKDTKPGDFFARGADKVQVPMMHAQGVRTRFFDDKTTLGLELPYKGGELSMILLMPKKADGLPALEKALPANLKTWLGKLSVHEVQLALPKFKFTSEFNLTYNLDQMGMKDAFDRGKADFSGMSSRERLFIKHVLHKAFVDVNEAGTEAAASTAAVVEGLSSLPPPGTFIADHPFVFLIREARTGSILFLGRVLDPRGA